MLHPLFSLMPNPLSVYPHDVCAEGRLKNGNRIMMHKIPMPFRTSSAEYRVVIYVVHPEDQRVRVIDKYEFMHYMNARAKYEKLLKGE